MDLISFLRQFRIGGYAVFDFAVSFLGIYFIAPYLTILFRKFKLEIPRISWMYFTIPLSIITHILIGRFTPLTLNFLDRSGHYLVKVVIIVLILLGIKDVHLIKKSKKQLRNLK